MAEQIWRSEDAEVNHRTQTRTEQNVFNVFVKENLGCPVIIKLKDGSNARSILLAQGNHGSLLVVGSSSLNWAIIRANHISIIALENGLRHNEIGPQKRGRLIQ